MKNRMKPQTLKGFYDYFSDDMRIRNFIKDSFREIAEEYGFEPLETPALEYSELILGQSGEEAEKLYYKFKDNGDRDVMLKYELMIPMCRAVAQNINSIILPYKRYQVQNVWRAENVQRGRLREFTQMDVDILGSSSPLADAEIILFGISFLKKIGFENFRVRLNSREIIQGIVEVLEIEESKFEKIYISIDKLEKIGKEKVREILIMDSNIEKEKVDKLLEIIEIKEIDKISNILENSIAGKNGVENIKKILSIINGIEQDKVLFDPSLARGLTSYTGAVWEFEIIEGNIGSVSGGGRYDKAVSKYLGREIPATGTSFGLERLTEVIKQMEMLKTKDNKSVLIIPIDESSASFVLSTTKKLREQNIQTNIYPDFVKLKESLKYANKKEYTWVIIIGENETSSNTLTLRNMLTQEQFTLTIKEAINKIQNK
ncbi:MAG TPA: histidine--tRNA ligase [Candidatus Dojkabacteria bacterium]|nr:histidine--tRNA ligase [Candidatus Dojkabacteria bacterium]